MYPWELEDLIKKNNGMLGGDDLLRAISAEENNLINIKFIPAEQKYYLEDRENNHHEFIALPYKKDTSQEESKVFVKSNQSQK